MVDLAWLPSFFSLPSFWVALGSVSIFIIKFNSYLKDCNDELKKKKKKHIDDFPDFQKDKTPLKTFILELIETYMKYESNHWLISVTYWAYVGVITCVSILFVIQYSGIVGAIPVILEGCTTLLVIFLAVNFVKLSSKNLEW